mmetsp:Transcript_17801/g.24863  ORF Transcript_17801/g.24863 Transcript_17801/m.24863 type:complete len:255 (+) Transcript_17801:197-961(+)
MAHTAQVHSIVETGCSQVVLNVCWLLRNRRGGGRVGGLALAVLRVVAHRLLMVISAVMIRSSSCLGVDWSRVARPASSSEVLLLIDVRRLHGVHHRGSGGVSSVLRPVLVHENLVVVLSDARRVSPPAYVVLVVAASFGVLATVVALDHQVTNLRPRQPFNGGLRAALAFLCILIVHETVAFQAVVIVAWKVDLHDLAIFAEHLQENIFRDLSFLEGLSLLRNVEFDVYAVLLNARVRPCDPHCALAGADFVPV